MQEATVALEPLRTYVLILDQGEEVVERLESFAARRGIGAASFTAIGAISEGTLGFFDPDLRDYRKIQIAEQSEVLSLLGDITLPAAAGSRPAVHGHMVVGGADGRANGGHLIDARVRPTLEVTLTEAPAHLRRRYDPSTGLALIDLTASQAAADADPVGGGTRAWARLRRLSHAPGR